MTLAIILIVLGILCLAIPWILGLRQPGNRALNLVGALLILLGAVILILNVIVFYDPPHHPVGMSSVVTQ